MPCMHRLQVMQLANGAYLEWVDCWFDKPLWRPVHCGHFHTAPEAGVDPGRFRRCRWCTSRAGSGLRTGPPVPVYRRWPRRVGLAGPDKVEFWLDWVEQTQWPADLVLYDQRGVGLSQPALDCPELRALRRELLPLPLPTEEAYRRVREATRACHDRLTGDGAGPVAASPPASTLRMRPS